MNENDTDYRSDIHCPSCGKHAVVEWKEYRQESFWYTFWFRYFAGRPLTADGLVNGIVFRKRIPRLVFPFYKSDMYKA